MDFSDIAATPVLLKIFVYLLNRIKDERQPFTSPRIISQAQLRYPQPCPFLLP